jgi:hypothetical protein
MVKGMHFLLRLGWASLLYGCSVSSENITVFSYSYEFSTSDEGWDGDFAGYPEGDSVFYGLKFKYDTVPGTKGNRKGLMLGGNNHSGSLFMFVRKKLTGLKPNTTYRVLFNVRLASKEKTGSGAPGESVFVKAGVTRVQPKKVLTDGTYRMNVNIGSQAEAGPDVLVLGHIGVSATTSSFTEVYRNNNASSPFQVTTGQDGEVWVFIGTDSGYAGVTTVYFTGFDVFFNQAE